LTLAFGRTQRLAKEQDPFFGVHRRRLLESRTVVAEWSIHKVPVLVAEVVAIADVAAGSRSRHGVVHVGVVAITANVIGPDGGEHEHELLSLRGRCACDAVAPHINRGIPRQEVVDAVSNGRVQELVRDSGDGHVPLPVPGEQWRRGHDIAAGSPR
jgi:hypothetical protein